MKLLFSFALCFFLNSCLAQSHSSFAEKEPPLKFQLIINNKSFNVIEGEDVELQSTFANPKVSIKVFDNRTFDNALLSFDYPRYFTFEYEGDNESKIWTLSGNTLTIMLFTLTEATSLDGFVEGLVSNFGKENCKVEKTKKALGGKTLQGKRINITLVSNKLTLDVLELQPSKSFITFQDTKTDDNKASEENNKVAELLHATIKYK